MTFAIGERVIVSDRSHVGHHRTPAYLKGKHGTVARVHGTFTNPETSAYGKDGLPERRLYLVSFPLAERDRILADVFEHWLEQTT